MAHVQSNIAGGGGAGGGGAAPAAAGASAFFAKKKKPGKKSFKPFNANKIDVSAVSSTVHVDAPPTSSDARPGVSAPDPSSSAGTTNVSPVSQVSTVTDKDGPALAGGANDEWEDIPSNPKGPAVAVTSGRAASELLDMAALQEKRREEDDIAEKLRIEETRNQLQSAKVGMEREAKRLQEEMKQKQQKKQEAAAAPTKPRFGAAAAMAAGDSGGGGGGKWVPPHMRNSGGAGLGGGGMGGSPMGMSRMGGPSGANFRRNLDTQDESAFPDLASADSILAAKQKMDSRPAYVLPKKKASTGSAWGVASAGPSKGGPKAAGTKPAANPKIPSSAPSSPPKAVKEPSASKAASSPTSPSAASAAKSDPAPTTKETTTPATTTTTPAVASPAPAAASVVRKKKKKKDLSTFKASS